MSKPSPSRAPVPSQSLDLRQTQQLVMTPQLQQAIKLLQLSNMELSEFIEEELEHNPLLEKAENQGEAQDAGTDAEEAAEPQQSATETKDAMDEAFAGGQEDFDPGSAMATVGAGGNASFEEPDGGFENRMALEKTLREHLNEQLFLAFEDGRERMIGGLLIDQLDEAGYLRGDTAELAQQLGCPEERIAELLRVLKEFDPTGIFAADLAECLALQLEERGQLDAPMQKLLQHLDLLGERDYKKLAGICGVNETYVRDMAEEIQALNPKPAADFGHLVVQTAIPDVLMKRLPKNLGGGWRVELNNETLPRVLVNREYYTEVAGRAVQKKDKEYLSSKLSAANWLVRALDQRAQTILKVAGEIVAQQDAFFNYGIEFLQPLTLRDIAGEIEMHESTVSRVTTNKYIGTPRGIFELKFFFTSALGGEGGAAAHSSEAVKARIRALIEAEDARKILSDDKIVALLKGEGVEIARRTVAKYREAMHIPSSVQRRKQKRNQLTEKDRPPSAPS